MASPRGPMVPQCRRCGRDNVANQTWRGMCQTCGWWVYSHGDLLEYPRLVRTRDEVLDDVVMLRGEGYTWPQIAERMKMLPDSLECAIRRARRAGDPRVVELDRRDRRVDSRP